MLYTVGYYSCLVPIDICGIRFSVSLGGVVVATCSSAIVRMAARVDASRRRSMIDPEHG